MSDGNSVINWDNVRARASVDPFFLGWALDEYMAAHQISNQQLADVLECRNQDLVRLSLCRLPDDTGPAFRAEIQRISDYIPCNANRLVMLIREVVATRKLSGQVEEHGTGLLMAARDRQSGRKDSDQDDSGNQR